MSLTIGIVSQFYERRQGSREPPTYMRVYFFIYHTDKLKKVLSGLMLMIRYLPFVPHYSSINRRINKLDIKLNNIRIAIIALDSLE
ncbi:MAG: hypothetical protein JO327_08510 [Nitrososphaeraceae archaeon]|nr:hypothetical protein [Nitrososphaeraceae archaeon]